MAAPIGPGDWIECVDAANLRLFGIIPTPIISGLRARNLYQVADLAHEATPFGRHCVVLLVGCGFQSFSLRRFRPIYRPKREIIEALRAPPARVRQTEDA